MLDTIMLRLRTSDGLDMASFSGRFGGGAAAAVSAALTPHERRGLVLRLPRLSGAAAGSSSAVPQESGQGAGQAKGINSEGHDWDFRFRLSDPEGFLLSNSVIADVFAAFSFKKG